MDAVRLAILPSASATLIWVVPRLNSECNRRPCCHARMVSSTQQRFHLSQFQPGLHGIFMPRDAGCPHAPQQVEHVSVAAPVVVSGSQSAITPSANATRLPPGEGGGLIAQRAPRCLNTTGFLRSTRYAARSSSVMCPPSCMLSDQLLQPIHPSRTRSGPSLIRASRDHAASGLRSSSPSRISCPGTPVTRTG